MSSLIPNLALLTPAYDSTGEIERVPRKHARRARGSPKTIYAGLSHSWDT